MFRFAEPEKVIFNLLNDLYLSAIIVSCSGLLIRESSGLYRCGTVSDSHRVPHVLIVIYFFWIEEVLTKRHPQFLTFYLYIAQQ